jgi:YcxB-like protein
MIVKTRNYRLERPLYIKLALGNVLKQQWWTIPIAVGICLLYLWIPSFWWIFAGLMSYGLYVLFWLVQFYGITQLDQGKMLFERLSYEITSQQIIMKINPREGMPMKWDQIKRAKTGKDYYLLFVNKAQLIHLPFKIFNSDNERKFLGSILKTKGLIG